MSDQAIEYVRSLDRRQITWKQKSILKVIAEYHKCHQKGAHFSFKTLMDETFTDRSNLQKQLARLEDLNLIEYTPGCGQGNYSHFRFLALDFERQAQRRSKGGRKGGRKGGCFRAPNKERRSKPKAKSKSEDFRF